MPTINTATTSTPSHPEPSPEPHFGDLRKGAYLRRRAAYLLQLDGSANLPSCKVPAQAANDQPGEH